MSLEIYDISIEHLELRFEEIARYTAGGGIKTDGGYISIRLKDGTALAISEGMLESLSYTKTEIDTAIGLKASKLGIILEKVNDLQYRLMVDGVQQGTIDIPKDRFIQSASYDPATHRLTLVFITSSGEESVDIDLSDLIDVYSAGSGLELSAGQFSVKVKTGSKLSATAEGMDVDLSEYVVKVEGKGLSTEDYTAAEKSKLGALPTRAELTAEEALKISASDIADNLTTDDAAKVLSAKQGKLLKAAQDAHKEDLNNPHAVTKSQVGLGNVDNTSDLNKPISTAQQAALDGKEPADATILKKADVVNDLSSGGIDVPLSAEQGKALKDAQDAHEDRLDTLEGTGAGSVAKAIADLAGSGRTTETVKKNADDISAMNVELLDSRHSNVSDETYESLGKRLDGIDDSYNRMASWSAKRFGLRFYTDTGEFARIGDAVGMVHRNHAGSYTPGVYSDFSFEDPWGGIKPCKMDDDGHILGWHGDPGYELLDGDEMVFIPRVFTGWTAKVVGGRPCIDIEASPAQLPGLYPTGFIGSDGQLLRGIYVGRTKLGESGGTLVTKSGVAPKTNKSMVSFNTDIRAKGTNANWRLNDFAAWMLTTTLMAIEIGTFDVKTAIGPGIQSGMPYGSGTEFKCTISQTGANSIVIANAGATNMRVGMVMQVGTTYTNNSVAADRAIVSIEDYDVDNKRITLDGAAFDSVAGTTTIVSWGQPVPADQMDALNGESGYILQFDAPTRSHVCWRWMWDLWGNVWEWLAGILRVSGKFYISFDRDLHAETSPAGKAGWIDTGYTPIVENGYQKEREVITYNDGQISLPKTTGGSGVGANSWYAAYLYYFGADYQTSTRAVLVSGSWYTGASVSPFCWIGGSGPSDADISVGARAVIEQEAV